MNYKFKHKLPAVIEVFKSIVNIQTTVFDTEFTNISLSEINDDIINTVKQKITTIGFEGKSFLTIKTSPSEIYAIKELALANIPPYYFLLGPIRNTNLLNFSNSLDEKLLIRLDYTFKLLIIMLEDMLKDMIFESPIKDFHVTKAISLIHENYYEDLTIDSLSQELNINKCYFCSIFKRETGFTFSKFLNKFRVVKSKELLKDKNLSILDVAMSVGFNNQNYFSIAFKSFEGITPSEYRKSQYI